MSSRIWAVVSELEREKAIRFSRSVSDSLVIDGGVADLAESIGARTKNLNQIKDEVLDAAYSVFLKAYADPKFEEKVVNFAAAMGVPKRQNTPLGTTVSKIFFTQNKSTARDRSLLLRAACWAEVKPGELSAGLRTGALAASHLVRKFKADVDPQASDDAVQPPKLKWDRATLVALAQSQRDGDVLRITAIREGAAFIVCEATVDRE